MRHVINLPYSKTEKATIKFNDYSVRIVDSYKVKSSKHMKYILQLVEYASKNYNIKYERTISSWMREWKAHNILYALRIRRSSSQHTDLDEDESLGRRIAYFILSLFYWR